MCLATMADVYVACVVRVTIFSTGGKFRLVSNFTELHTLSHSYVLLVVIIFICDYCNMHLPF